VNETSRIWIGRVAVAAGIILLWQFLPIDSFWLSTPAKIAAYIGDELQHGKLLADLGLTARETATGYVGGAILGLLFGVAIAQSERAAMILRPFILAIDGVPRIALAPIFILWFGISFLSKVYLAGLMTFMLVFLNAYEGVRASDPDLRNVARVLGASRWQMFWQVTLPNASPWIISGLRIAIPQALAATVVAEFIASTGGMGYFIMQANSALNTTGTMAGIVILMIIVVVLNFILDAIERRVLRWRPRVRGAK